MGRLHMSLLTVLVIAACCQLLDAADRTNFKTCEQSGFCRRNRNIDTSVQRWSLVPNSLKVSSDSANFLLKDTVQGHEYQATVSALLDGQTFRFTVDDPHSIRKRFDSSNLVLVAGLKRSPLSVKENKDGSIVVEVVDTIHKQNNKLIIHNQPFHMNVYSGDTLTMVANQRNMFNFEKARTKDEAAEQQCSDGCWEESFKGSTDSKPHGPMSVGMDVTFVNFEHVYGIPSHADDLSLRNTKGNMDPYRLYNVDIFEYELESPMSLYGAYPLMIAHSTKPMTVGVFWLNPSETWIDVESSNSGGLLSGIVGGNEASKQSHWMSETGTIDVMFLLGPSPSDVMTQNGQLMGNTPLPPIYSLGHHQCRWNYYSVDEVMDVDQKADIYEIPVDSIWLDIEYTDGRSKKYFTWDPVTFGHHEQMIRNLTSKGRRLIAIIDPHIKREVGYSIYDECTANGYFTKDSKEDKDFEGWCWPGSSSWVDYLNPVVREWWADKYSPKHFPGFDGGLVDIWNDMNEPSVFSGPEVTAPRDMRHFDDVEHRDLHNMYGFLMTMSTHAGLVKHRPNLRPFILTRSFFAGSQRAAAVWTGDNMCKWDHLKASIPMLLSHSIVGISFIGADIPGFFHDPESEEIVLRWYQAAVFYPFFRAHAHVDTKRREPWIFSKDTLDGIRTVIQTRYSYMPYIYQRFHENELTGVPPMRPLWMEFPTDAQTLGMGHVFMMGPALLNAPILDKGVQSLQVYLPASTSWLHLQSMVIYEGGQTIDLPVDANSVPIFQRAGNVVPRRLRVRRALALSTNDPISLDIFADKAGKASGELYLDDGHSFDYRQSRKFISGKFSMSDKRFSYVFTDGVKDSNSAWLERVTIYNFASKPSKILSGDGKVQLAFKYDAQSKILVVRKIGCTFSSDCSFKIL